MDTTFVLDELSLSLGSRATFPLLSAHPVTLDVRAVYTPASRDRADEPGAPDAVEILRVRTRHRTVLLDGDGDFTLTLRAGADITRMLSPATFDFIADALRPAFREEPAIA